MRSTELPAPLRWAVWLLIAEAAGAGLVAGFLGFQALAATPVSVADALAVAGFVALVAAALGGLAAALWRHRPRARAPAIVLQLLVVMLAVVLVSGGLVWLGAPIAVLGVAVATLLLAPSTHTALGG